MIISRTPLRMSFTGGGSDIRDYYQHRSGHVISTAINKYIYIMVERKFDSKIRVSYSKTEEVEHVDQVEHNIIREAMKITGVTSGVDIVYQGDVPLGTAGIGLGSSSALAVGVLNALYAYRGVHASAERLAREACQIEIDILKNPIGKQDQYMAAYGGFQSLKFNPDETVEVNPIIMWSKTKHELNQRLVLFYTGKTRISSHILKEQSINSKYNKTSLDYMVGLSLFLEGFLRQNSLKNFGSILNEGWEEKKRLASGISNSEIDKLYEEGIKADASGGKLLGAGGGGFLLFYCEPEHMWKVEATLTSPVFKLKKTPFKFEPQGSKIIYVSE